MAKREFVLPDLGEGLEEAEISSWLVAEGDAVELNQPLVEVETAKATVEIPSPFAGRIAKLHAAAGDTIKVGAPLVTFDLAGEMVGGTSDVEAGGIPAPPANPDPTPAQQGPAGQQLETLGARPGPAPATPAVRKLAKDLGIDLDALRGSGPDGRITREDVEASAPGQEETQAVTEREQQDIERVPVSRIRRGIADNLTRAAQIPQVTTFRTVDCMELERFRGERGVSPLPVLVKALANICVDHPLMNATWSGDAILVHKPVHVGVATDTERGLLVPVVRDAHRKGIGDIADEIRRLAAAAREGTLTPADAANATITVTNTGSYGSEFGTPLLNPLNAAILGFGVIAPRALVVEGQVAARLACTLSVTFDHRVLDGAEVGRALNDLVDLLQQRERLEALPR